MLASAASDLARSAAGIAADRPTPPTAALIQSVLKRGFREELRCELLKRAHPPDVVYDLRTMLRSALDILQSELPDVFDLRPPPPGLEGEWLVVPEADANQLIFDLLSSDDAALPGPIQAPTAPPVDDVDSILGSPQAFPGAPQSWSGGSPVPPPDALAFYLPFHYYYPNWWGIYLTVEGTLWLARWLVKESNGSLSERDAVAASRNFLYGHEAFHHLTECLATRLEITHRDPLYKRGFEELYQRTKGTDGCIEEALANVHGLQRAKSRTKAKKKLLEKAFVAYFAICPPGYRRASDFAAPSAFKLGKFGFAEENHVAALPKIGKRAGELWEAFPNAFSGLSRVTSRVNYVIRADSPLASRLRLRGRLLKPKELARKLKSFGCAAVREGKGSHEIWQSAEGHRFPVPRHAGDLTIGTLRGILRQANIRMGIEEFLAASV